MTNIFEVADDLISRAEELLRATGPTSLELADAYTVSELDGFKSKLKCELAVARQFHEDEVTRLEWHPDRPVVDMSEAITLIENAVKQRRRREGIADFLYWQNRPHARKGPDYKRLKALYSLLDVVREYVQLTKAGRAHKGLCPFHSERTPSFFVYPDGHYHCYGGCNAHGDVIDFMRRVGDRRLA